MQTDLEILAVKILISAICKLVRPCAEMNLLLILNIYLLKPLQKSWLRAMESRHRSSRLPILVKVSSGPSMSNSSSILTWQSSKGSLTVKSNVISPSCYFFGQRCSCRSSHLSFRGLYETTTKCLRSTTVEKKASYEIFLTHSWCPKSSSICTLLTLNKHSPWKTPRIYKDWRRTWVATLRNTSSLSSI